jgi:hypothetical protein
MTTYFRARPVRVGMILLATMSLAFGLAFGSAMASGSRVATFTSSLPCNSGGPDCSNIGFTKAWFNGHTVKVEYSHPFFCAEPPASGASTNCEAGEAATVEPPSGPVVSELYVLIPRGFTPPDWTLHCGTSCIGQPRTMDLSRVFGGLGSNATLPPRSFVIEDKESFQSTWWPVVLVRVRTLHAWNTIAEAKTIESVDACQESGGCAPEAETNAFVFFQVLGPGMSLAGPA